MSPVYSLLLTIKERLPRRMFEEIVNLVIMGRADVGFIMHRKESYDFLPQESMAAFQELNTNIDEDVEDINKEIVVATMGSAK